MTGKLCMGVLFAIVRLGFSADSAAIDTPLTADQQKTFDFVAASFPVVACGSLPLKQAAVSKPSCVSAKHLYPFARWLAAKGKTNDECMKDLTDRQQSFGDTGRFHIDLTGVPIGGDGAAPVTIVVYVSGLCPLCKYVSCELYREVTSGALKGKVRLAIKPCRASRADEALVASVHFKKSWEFLDALHNVKIRPDEPVLLKIADSLGIPADTFKRYLDTRELRSVIERNSAEAVGNGVSIAPTIFINERRYHSYKDPRWVVDAALYENEKRERKGAHK